MARASCRCRPSGHRRGRTSDRRHAAADQATLATARIHRVSSCAAGTATGAADRRPARIMACGAPGAAGWVLRSRARRTPPGRDQRGLTCTWVIFGTASTAMWCSPATRPGMRPGRPGTSRSTSAPSRSSSPSRPTTSRRPSGSRPSAACASRSTPVAITRVRSIGARTRCSSRRSACAGSRSTRRRRARVEAGVLAKPLAVAAGEHGLAYLAGTAADVGVLGYALGGGLSWMVRAHGLACNSIVAAEVVTADGRRRRADRDTEPDLFWALRGGGGNVAAVTALELRLFPVAELLRRCPLLADRARGDLPRVDRDRDRARELRVARSAAAAPRRPVPPRPPSRRVLRHGRVGLHRHG